MEDKSSMGDGGCVVRGETTHWVNLKTIFQIFGELGGGRKFD